MTVHDFLATLPLPGPPAGLAPLLVALWWDAKGEWDKAHNLTDEIGHKADGAGVRDAAWVHAYLHRKEGDGANAGYWYRLAGRPHYRLPLEAEWSEIVAYLLVR